MKLQKLLSIILTVLICLTNIPISTITAEESETETIDIWDGSTDISWYDSEETEFYISTPEELAGLAELVNSGKSMKGQTFYLQNDIYLNDVSNYENWLIKQADVNSWIPIGKDIGNCFSGTFDGNGYTIKGLYINTFITYGIDGNFADDSDYVKYPPDDGSGFTRYSQLDICTASFIGYLISGEIKNLTLEKEYISSGSWSYYNEFYSGGICGYSDSSIISNSATYNGYVRAISADENGSDNYAGGICGLCIDTLIYNCKNTFDVRATCNGCAGGIAGYLDSSSVYNCINSGNINSYYYKKNGYASSCCSGGICGSTNHSGTIQNAYNIGNVKSAGYAGGIVGGFNSYKLQNTYYLSGTALYGVGNKSDNATIAKTEENMKTEDFAKALGKAFVYVEGEYPKLLWEMDYVVANFVEENIILTEYGQQKSPELVTNYLESPTWVSSDTSVATVENGTITAKNNGECIIYAVCGDIRAECNVTVDYGYTLNNTSIEINEDETVQLAVISDNTGLTAEGFEIEWTSSDESVVTVKNGTVTAVNDGMATITASFGNTSLECEVVVNALIPDPELNITSLELYEGETEELAVNNYTGNITWISDDTEVVKVENGIVKAIAPGNANIYAMLSNGTNFICSVTVNEAEVTSVITTNVTITETTTVTTIATTVTEETAKPDLNGDGKTNVTDVLILQKFLVKIPSDDNIKIIDINNDKKINVFDLIILKRFVLYN